MIIVCTHKSPGILKNCLQSIRKYSKEFHRILCVETSDSQESKQIAEDYDAFFENSELKYEIGAFNYATNLYPGEPEYFMFQDSVEVVAEDWERMFREPSKGLKMVSLCSYGLSEDPSKPCGMHEFTSLFNRAWPEAESCGVMTNCFYVPKVGKDKLKAFGIDKLVAETKPDTYMTERVLGAIAYYSCGLADAKEVAGEWKWDATHFRSDTGFTKFVYKHVLSRQ